MRKLIFILPAVLFLAPLFIHAQTPPAGYRVISKPGKVWNTPTWFCGPNEVVGYGSWDTGKKNPFCKPTSCGQQEKLCPATDKPFCCPSSWQCAVETKDVTGGGIKNTLNGGALITSTATCLPPDPPRDQNGQIVNANNYISCGPTSGDNKTGYCPKATQECVEVWFGFAKVKHCQPKSKSSCQVGESFAQGTGDYAGEKRCCPAGTTASKHPNGLPFCAQQTQKAEAPAASCNGAAWLGSQVSAWSGTLIGGLFQIALNNLYGSCNTYSSDGVAAVIGPTFGTVSGSGDSGDISTNPGPGDHPPAGRGFTYDPLNPFGISSPPLIFTLPPPTVDLKANGVDDLANGGLFDQVRLAWTSSNAIRCASGSENYNSPNWVSDNLWTADSRNIITGAIPYGQTAKFFLTCYNSEGNAASDSVLVRQAEAPSSAPVLPPPAVVIPTDIKVNGSDGPVTIDTNPFTTFQVSWTSGNTTNHCASGSNNYSGIWANDNLWTADTRDLLGGAIPFNQTAKFFMTCYDAQGNSGSDSVEVSRSASARLTNRLNLATVGEMGDLFRQWFFR